LATQIRNADLVNLLSVDLQARYEPNFALANAISTLLALPGLRGLWTMSSVDENGDALDLSEQGRTLTNNNTVTFGRDGLAPYANFVSASSQYLSRADEAGLDITGTESYIANPGLTLGGWFYATTAPGTTGIEVLIAKRIGGASNVAYTIHRTNGGAGGVVDGGIGNGVTTNLATTSSVMQANTWYFLAMRFTPSTEVAIFLNDEKDTVATAFASIVNNNKAIGIGAYGNGSGGFLDGRASLCFLCASALPDAIINNIYRQTRALFGV